jgi:LEA14-like dessication related protein
MSRLTRFALVALALVAVFGCSRPEPPTIQPERVQIAQITASGVAVVVALTVTNPNAIGLAVQSVRATMRLEDGTELGPMAVPFAAALPPKTPTPVSVPLTLPWAQLAALGQLAASNKDVGYEVSGTAAVGTERVHLDIPFRIRGVLGRNDLVRAALNSFPGLLGPAGK